MMVRVTLGRGSAGHLAEASLVDAFLEKKIDLGDGFTPSQADVLAVLALPETLAIMAVEGKVDESFGPRVSEWLKNASPQKDERLGRLCRTLGIDTSRAGVLRYQLLHRTASAIYEAKRYRAKLAVMMVHSFDAGDAGFTDFKHFASEMQLPDAAPTCVVGPKQCEGVDLYLGWAADRPSNEGFTVVNGRKTDEGFHDA